MLKLGRFALVASLVAFVSAGILSAQSPPQQKGRLRRATDAEEGMVGQITKVDKDKKTVTVTSDAGKEHVFTVGEKVKLLGANGRKLSGLDDKALKTGAPVTWRMDKTGKELQELHVRAADAGTSLKRFGSEGEDKEGKGSTKDKGKDKDKSK
jgi:hypothetical protein